MYANPETAGAATTHQGSGVLSGDGATGELVDVPPFAGHW